MSPQKTRFPVLQVAALALILAAACGCFVKPMSDPEKSVMDPTLVGLWRRVEPSPGKDDAGSKEGEKEKPAEEMALYPWDRRSYLMIVQQAESEGSEKKIVKAAYQVFITDTPKGRYLNLRFFEEGLLYGPREEEKRQELQAKKERSPKEQVELIMLEDGREWGMLRGYFFLKMRFRGALLELTEIEVPKELEGEAQALATSEEVRAWVLAHPELENEKKTSVFHRVLRTKKQKAK